MTLGLEGRCSIQLSYGRMSFFGSTRGTRTLKPDWATDFKSVAYASSAMVPKKWWASWGSNPVPPVYETGALTK